MIAAAAAQYPRQSWPLAAAVSLAIDRSAFTDAERLLNELITKFPAEPANWLEMANVSSMAPASAADRRASASA